MNGPQLCARLSAAALVVATMPMIIAVQSSGQGTAPADLFTRVGLTADETALARTGQPAVRVLPGTVDSEVAVAGAIRAVEDPVAR